MANSHVQFRWAGKPSIDELAETMDELRSVSPQPIIKLNIALKDVPHSSLEALLAFCGEHAIPVNATLTAIYEEGQQLTFWDNPAHHPAQAKFA